MVKVQVLLNGTKVKLIKLVESLTMLGWGAGVERQLTFKVSLPLKVPVSERWIKPSLCTP